MRPPACQRANPSALSFRDVGIARLDALCSAVGFAQRQKEQALTTLEEMLAPWGDWSIGEQPRFPSDIGDDHFPLEFSIALGDESVEIRVLVEAQTPSAGLAGLWAAGQGLNRLLQRRHGASLARFELISELFEPTASGARYAMWHGACFRPNGETRFKLYLNPQARGKQHAGPVVVEALRRLGFGERAREIATLPRSGGELKFFSLDLEACEQARVKVYHAHHAARRASIEAELRKVPTFSADALESFWRAIPEDMGPFAGLPPTTYLAFTAGHEHPTSGTVHFPVRDYADNDQVVYQRVTRWLDGSERELYERALAAFATRPLEQGVGLQSYVAQSVGPRGRRVTVYLSPEGYRVAPPRARPAMLRGPCTGLESTLHSMGFEGRVATDGLSLRGAARDMGGIISKRPHAVLRPRSIEDLTRAVRACRQQGVAVAVRGQGRSPFGQSQSDGGVVLDMGGLDEIHSITEDAATVDAGATWKSLLLRTSVRGLSPPVLTAFQGLSIGGTLSIGGLSGTSYKRGAQVDHVLELDVVTGQGKRVTCSRQVERDLFEVVLAGLGQCAIIARVTLADPFDLPGRHRA